jgi:hypothetical protein
METLEKIGQGESTTFVLPQELTSLVGRYGKQLTGSDVQDSEGLSSMEFDEETRELIGLDDIEEILGQIDSAAEMDVQQLEQEAEAIKAGEGVDMKSADEIIEEANEEDQIKSADEVVDETDTAEPTAQRDGQTANDDDKETELNK